MEALERIISSCRDSSSYGSVIGTLLCIFALSRAVKFANGCRAVNHLPGLRVPFQPLAAPGALIPSSWWNPGIAFCWIRRFEVYRKYNSDTISVVPFLAGNAVLYTSNLDVARQVIVGRSRSSFVKPESASQALLLWGMNLVASEGELWRKHRRIMGPAFNNQLYDMVATKTAEIFHDMVAAEFPNKDVIEVPVLQTLTFKFALLVIGACGFGFPFTWQEPAAAADGSMSVQDAISTVASSYLFSVSAPKWAWNLPFNSVRKIALAHTTLQRFMDEQVAERKTVVRGEHGKGQNDAFSNLVRANEESGKLCMSDTELIGNVFIMLFAGHETTAHTLAATLAFLSLERYQHIQEEVLTEIVSVIGYGRDPTLDDYSRLTKVLSVFYEALRMFPAGYVLIREADEDTVLEIPNPVGQEGSRSMRIPKGVQVIVDMIGVQYNPRYFENPETFDPSRWQDTESEPADAYSAFSVGPRACIGAKFAKVEAVCFLSLLLRDYKVEPKLLDNESEEQWEQRVLQANIVLTLGVANVSLRLTRRQRT